MNFWLVPTSEETLNIEKQELCDTRHRADFFTFVEYSVKSVSLTPSFLSTTSLNYTADILGIYLPLIQTTLQQI